jgi:antitoxin component YwqK of YwqJK toxin-antitoxin module
VTRLLHLVLVLAATAPWAASIVRAADVECPRTASLHGEAPPDGAKLWCALEDGTQHGPSISWSANGNVKAEANFDQGKLEGVYRIYHESGALQEEGHYIADKKNGMFTSWAEDGTKLLEQKFSRDQRDGLVQQWYPSGGLKFSENYRQGQKHGPAVAYFESGQKQSEGSFDSGKFEGTWSGWYPSGRKRKVAEFVAGERVKVEIFPDE